LFSVGFAMLQESAIYMCQVTIDLRGTSQPDERHEYWYAGSELLVLVWGSLKLLSCAALIELDELDIKLECSAARDFGRRAIVAIGLL